MYQDIPSYTGIKKFICHLPCLILHYMSYFTFPSHLHFRWMGVTISSLPKRGCRTWIVMKAASVSCCDRPIHQASWVGRTRPNRSACRCCEWSHILYIINYNYIYYIYIYVIYYIISISISISNYIYIYIYIYMLFNSYSMNYSCSCDLHRRLLPWSFCCRYRRGLVESMESVLHGMCRALWLSRSLAAHRYAGASEAALMIL